jgi:CRP/FNR family transcriptional regulator
VANLSAIDTRDVDRARGATVSSPLRSVVVNSRPSALRTALARVDELKRALLLSQQESVIAREHVAILTHANVQLQRRAFQREFEHSPVRGCPVWALADFSLAEGLDPEELTLVERLLKDRIRFRKGDTLYRCGGASDALYAIRLGTCKTVLLGRGGQEQVTGYHIIGDIVGLDGIAADVHECQAIALEDMEVYPFAFERLEMFARFSDRFRYNLHKLLSRECSRAQRRTLALGTMCADQRLALFLLDLSERYTARGFSSCEFVLRMTRDEIGSYLGLKLETVSRVFSRFQDQGVLQVQGRVVKLLDLVALRDLPG